MASLRVLEGVPSGHLNGVGGGGEGVPPHPSPSRVKVIQHRQNAKSAKKFDYEMMKNFLKVD